jgi:8-oxo-dGTP diphosphatase
MSTPTPEVRAAGGLVVRDGRVAVVHRPRYDDWSLPKGKIQPGETWEEGALREVQEECNLRCALGSELDDDQYVDHKGRTKQVRWWQMDVVEDLGFAPNEETDELRWLRRDEALDLLTYDHDRELVFAHA